MKKSIDQPKIGSGTWESHWRKGKESNALGKDNIFYTPHSSLLTAYLLLSLRLMALLEKTCRVDLGTSQCPLFLRTFIRFIYVTTPGNAVQTK